jgi:GMP synthase-like glutamine amidotransferase
MPSLRISLVDMNNGVANQATRCFRRIVDAFGQRVRERNPGLDVTFTHVQPRNLGELPPGDTDLLLSSGGPGSPYDGFDAAWCTGYRKFLDHVIEKNLKDPTSAPKALLVCHSFQLAVLHFGVATMEQRATKKFGLMTAYMTDAGEQADFLSPFGYRLFCWEHRNWEAIDLDAKRLKELDGEVYATETHASHPQHKYKGDALLALRFAAGIEGTQFHPEADKPGVMAWVEKPESQDALRIAYGETLLEKMKTSLGNPERLAKTFALLIPGWLTHRFNTLSEARGWKTLDAPVQDMREFDVAV